MPPSDHLATDRGNDETNKNSNATHNVHPQPSADSYKSALFRSSSVSHQARELQRNAKTTTDSTKHIGRGSPDEPEDYVFDVFAEEDERNDDNTQPKGTVVSGRNSTPNTKISEQ